jgi:hypothetical protein
LSYWTSLSPAGIIWIVAGVLLLGASAAGLLYNAKPGVSGSETNEWSLAGIDENGALNFYV